MWNSPTIMTWMSYSTKALSLFIVLPLILKNFSAAEVSLYYLFTSIVVLIGLADFGFRSTFSRVISFAYGGASDIGIFKGTEKAEVGKESNWTLLENIFSSMKRIYALLSGVLLILFLSLGSWSLIKPINEVADAQQAWIAWGVIILTSVLKFYGTIYQNYLEGLFKIALVRRIEAVMQLGAICTSILILVFGGNILHLIIGVQVWQVMNVGRNWYLTRVVEEGRYRLFKNKPFDKLLFHKIWHPAWRSGLSGLMSNGLTQLTGILYAQVGAPEMVAAYLLALKIMTQIKEISMAPFYSKIPLMSRKRVEGKMEDLIKIAQRGMLLGHGIFVSGVIFVSLFSGYLLELIDSRVPFVESQFWLLLSLAFFIHRYGAMHIQLYLTTNHVISHIADGISGIIFIITAFVLVKIVGLYAIPLGMIAGYLGFYAWFAVYYSLKSLNMRFFEYERKASLIPIGFFCIFILISIKL